MPKKNPTTSKHTPPPEPENVGRRCRGASHKKCKINLWDESEMVWCLQEFNRQLVIFQAKKRVASVHVVPNTDCSFGTF